MYVVALLYTLCCVVFAWQSFAFLFHQCLVCVYVFVFVCVCVFVCQTMELSSKYPEHLTEEVSSFYAYNFVQLVLVSLPYHKEIFSPALTQSLISPPLYSSQQSIPINDQRKELVVHLYYKQLQSDLPTRVRCSDPGESRTLHMTPLLSALQDTGAQFS